MELKLTLPEELKNVDAKFETNEETGTSRLTILTHKARIQYVAKLESQEQLDAVVDVILYMGSF